MIKCVCKVDLDLVNLCYVDLWRNGFFSLRIIFFKRSTKATHRQKLSGAIK